MYLRVNPARETLLEAAKTASISGLRRIRRSLPNLWSGAFIGSGQLAPPLPSPSHQNSSSVSCTHSGPEPEFPGPLEFAWLIRSLHVVTPCIAQHRDTIRTKPVCVINIIQSPRLRL